MDITTVINAISMTDFIERQYIVYYILLVLYTEIKNLAINKQSTGFIQVTQAGIQSL